MHTFYRDYAHADREFGTISDDAVALKPTHEDVSCENGSPKYHVVREGSLIGKQVKEYLITVVAGGSEIWEVLL